MGLPAEISCLSGVTIRELSVVQECVSGDAFIVSRQYLDVRNPLHWYSNSISFDTLSSSVANDVSSCWRLGSMAWESSCDYSRRDHTHGQYSKVTGISCYYDASQVGTLDLGTIIVNGMATHVIMPAPFIQEPDEPVIGQLRFSALPGEPPEIDWQSDDFDGWVYPDGKAYPQSVFFQIDDQFQMSGDYFIVPSISDFIRLNPTPYQLVNVEQDYSEFFPPHLHTIDVQLSGELSGQLNYRVSHNGTGTNHHGASKRDRYDEYSLSIDCSGLVPESKGYIQQCEENGSESFPSYYGLRTLIYIGKPSWQETNQ